MAVQSLYYEDSGVDEAYELRSPYRIAFDYQDSLSNYGEAYEAGFDAGVDSVVTDPTHPQLAVVFPTAAPGQPGGFPKSYAAAKDTAVVLELTDPSGNLGSAFVSVRFAGSEDEIVVYRGSNFRGRFLRSHKENIANGIRLTIKRDGGWPRSSSGGVAYLTFSVDAVDALGNELE